MTYSTDDTKPTNTYNYFHYKCFQSKHLKKTTPSQRLRWISCDIFNRGHKAYKHLQLFSLQIFSHQTPKKKTPSQRLRRIFCDIFNIRHKTYKHLQLFSLQIFSLQTPKNTTITKTKKIFWDIFNRRDKIFSLQTPQKNALSLRLKRIFCDNNKLKKHKR